MSDDRRFEIKIPVPLMAATELQRWLRLNPSAFRHHYDDRYVNSLYCDTADLTRYDENLSGISQRRKVRIRWYHELTEPSKARLEFKIRVAGKGYKEIFPINLAPSTFDQPWSDQLREARRELPVEAIAMWGVEQMPVLICRYRRSYYLSACGRFRATIDRDIEVFDQRYNSRPNVTRSRSLGAYILLELKASDAYEDELARIASSCPLRPSRHSKYVNGIRNLTWL